MFRHTSFLIIREFIAMSFSYFLKTNDYLKTKRFFYISLSTSCDPYKIDYDIVRNCQNEIICVDSKSGKLGYQGSICLYGMNLEKASVESEKSHCELNKNIICIKQ